MKSMKKILSACMVAALLILSFAVALADSVIVTAPEAPANESLMPHGKGNDRQTPSNGNDSAAQTPQFPANGAQGGRSGSSSAERGSRGGNHKRSAESADMSGKWAEALDLDRLVGEGVISQETADAIRACLQEKDSPQSDDNVPDAIPGATAPPEPDGESGADEAPDAEATPGGEGRSTVQGKREGRSRTPAEAFLNELLEKEIITRAELDAILAALD